MGLIILALFLITALLSLCPKKVRAHASRFMGERAVFFKSLYIVFFAMFVVFGASRSLLYLCRTLQGTSG
jgi:hypothetical protein